MYENWLGFGIIYIEAVIVITAIYTGYKIIKTIRRKVRRRVMK